MFIIQHQEPCGGHRKPNFARERASRDQKTRDPMNCLDPFLVGCSVKRQRHLRVLVSGGFARLDEEEVQIVIGNRNRRTQSPTDVAIGHVNLFAVRRAQDFCFFFVLFFGLEGGKQTQCISITSGSVFQFPVTSRSLWLLARVRLCGQVAAAAATACGTHTHAHTERRLAHSQAEACSSTCQLWSKLHFAVGRCESQLWTSQSS